MAYPIDLFCVHHLADTECLEADHNGGSVRGTVVITDHAA